MNVQYGACRRGFLFALLALLCAGCPDPEKPSAPPPSTAGEGSYQPQGWDAAETEAFYYTSQGSQLIPRAWLLALERHDSEQRFLSDGLARFGYLPGTRSSLNRHGLPVGFAVDTDDRTKVEWVGMTCAACHTSQITYRGESMRIEGGPGGADMYEFLAKLDLALRKTATDNAAFTRFEKAVLGGDSLAPVVFVKSLLGLGDYGRDSIKLRADLKKFSDDFAQFVVDSTPKLGNDPQKPAPRWGPARLDAFGMIFNRVTGMDLGIRENIEPPNAPVSYPFLWGTSWHPVTQWNGMVENHDELRRLSRNTGQVLGVFGKIDFTKPGLSYPSSVQRRNLVKIERSVAQLTAPVWPDTIFGKPDPGRVARGKQLYVDRGCRNCHELVPKDDQQRPAGVKVIAVETVGTDDTMTRMAATRTAATGILENRPTTTNIFDGLGPRELAGDILAHAVIGALTQIDVIFSSVQVDYEAFVFPYAVGYKARPLNGIWATGPYLHNGSVRTLWQLLKPEARESKFYVGSREFDPKEVGFVNQPGVIAFELDTAIPGNRNSGHERFVERLKNDEERWDLIEYLKTL